MQTTNNKLINAYLFAIKNTNLYFITHTHTHTQILKRVQRARASHRDRFRIWSVSNSLAVRQCKLMNGRSLVRASIHMHIYVYV